MRTYRIYGTYVQRVWIEVIAKDIEVAGDIAVQTPVENWIPISNTEIDITEVE